MASMGIVQLPDSEVSLPSATRGSGAQSCDSSTSCIHTSCLKLQSASHRSTAHRTRTQERRWTRCCDLCLTLEPSPKDLISSLRRHKSNMSQWTYFYLDPALKNTRQSTWKRPQRPEDSDFLVDGDIVEIWNHVFRWDDSCVSDKTFNMYRFQGDKLVDAALPSIQAFRNINTTDQFARLEAAATSLDASPEVLALWKQLHSTDSFEWPNEAQLERGRAVLYRYAPYILASLLHWSLSAGFCSPRIARVLNLASYICPPMRSTPEGEAPRISPQSNDRSYMRLMETTQFVIDSCSKGGLVVGAEGWKSIIRVCSSRAGKERDANGYSIFDERAEGIPISQADMIFTLTAFSTAPMHCLRKAGITPTKQECEDWTALWRVTGFYLGLDPSFLRKHHTTYKQSESLLASTILSAFAAEDSPPPPVQFPFDTNLVPKQQQVQHITHITTLADPYASPPTLPVLLCICNRWPIPFTFRQHCAAARQLCGPTLSDWLSIPTTTWFETAQMRLGYFLGALPPRFGRIWRAGWDLKRREAMEASVKGAVELALGLRRTAFRPRKESQYEPEKVGDEFFGVSRFENVKSAIELWGALYGEMAIVCAVVGIVGCTLAPVTVPALGAWLMFGR
ncbi:hypothetical protein DOTSEDRAFT_82677 [Dothistroma septosporum NZE10]|uniref:ER-bound oxygenase mpaB/mpaB'/Rubber oxygenase catalytic domain-containing protein n=1 Tax=Dothistroma septosporum (strain NZE10 / CBS 128990) TaxID=675120 RepID=N1PCE9_DOTSN|nr:hypothetical protein DOTSEDRAFT_82677 [Dothistroma septosporum NZE10]